MVASQIRQEARNSLTGKWGKAALITLIYVVFTFVISFILALFSAIPLIRLIAIIANYAIMVPLSFGILVSMIKLRRNEEVNYTDFLNDGFSMFEKVWKVVGNIALKLLVLIILILVFAMIFTFGLGGSATSVILGSSIGTAGFSILGIIGFIGYIVSIILIIPKSYLYVLSFYLLHDHPDMAAKEIVEKSEALMNGHRWNFFWLLLTFIGWAFLSIFTFYIGLLWLMPYVMVAGIVFYEQRINMKETIVTETATIKTLDENQDMQQSEEVIIENDDTEKNEEQQENNTDE